VPVGRRLVEAPNATEVTVGLRPEGAELRLGDADVTGAVVTAMVLGDRLQVVVRLGDGQELLVRQGRSAQDAELAALGPGDEVGVEFRAGAGLLVAAGGDGHRPAAPADAGEGFESTLRSTAT
jgi:hypothetical protein